VDESGQKRIQKSKSSQADADAINDQRTDKILHDSAAAARLRYMELGHASIRWCVRRRRAHLMPFMGRSQNVLAGFGLTRVWAFRR
jgi:hypothetical protein